MSLELIRESIRVNQLIGEDVAQTIVENDIIVPDVKPDIARVLLLDGDVVVNNADAAEDRIMVSGIIRFKILYISDDELESIKSINTNSQFTYGIDVPKVKSGMKCKARCEIEHMDYELLNGRKLNVKTIMKVSGKAQDEFEQNVISGVSNVDNLQVLNENLRLNSFVGDTNYNFLIREALEVPAGKPTIREILRTDVKIGGKDYKLTEGKIIAKGDLNISTLYIGDNEERDIQFMEHEIPFTQFIDLPGVDENTLCDIDYRIDDMDFQPEEDSDGELRVISGEMSISINAAGYKDISLDTVVDGYSPKLRLNIEKEPFRTEEIAAENKSQVILKDTLTINEENPEIAEVFNVLCKPSLSEARIYDDKLVIEGVVKNNILYLANSTEQPVFCSSQEIPFKHGVDIKGIRPEMNCDIGLDIEHCNYSMISGTEVEVRLVIGLNIKVIKQTVLPLVIKVTEQPVDENRVAMLPSIVIYFTKPGDSLWKIAKEYYTTADYIQSVNNLSGNEALSPGQQIIIPKKVSV